MLKRVAIGRSVRKFCYGNNAGGCSVILRSRGVVGRICFDSKKRSDASDLRL